MSERCPECGGSGYRFYRCWDTGKPNRILTCRLCKGCGIASDDTEVMRRYYELRRQLTP